jgi:hypothetical protein
MPGHCEDRRAIDEADEMCVRLQAIRDLLVTALALIGAGLWVGAIWPHPFAQLEGVLLAVWIPGAATTFFVIFRQIAWHRRFEQLTGVPRHTHDE